MKNIITILILTFLSITTIAQQGINYKALVKDGNGNIVTNQSITMQFTILQGVEETNVYQETHTPATNANGIVVVNIGEGTPDSGVFADIEWGTDNHFLNVLIDTGEGLIDMGTTQFMAVPYAKFAENAQNVNELQAQIIALNERVTNLELPYIGQYRDRDGGIVFWIDPTDPTHGLVCALEDQKHETNYDGGAPWSNGEYEYDVTNGLTIGTGLSNTDAIIAFQGPIETDYAAGLARAHTGGGFTDWFLPSRDELYQMWLNRTVINAAAPVYGGEILDLTKKYWSSSTFEGSGLAECIDMENGIDTIEKIAWLKVRAVRAF